MQLNVALSVGSRPSAMALPYDPASQVTQILHQLTATSTPINQAAYAYNQVGNRTSLTDRRGAQAFGYDNLDRLTSASHPLLATPQAFAYDPVGNRTTGGSVVNAGNQLTADANYGYQYDDNGNLTRKTLLATGNYTQYTYDAENRLVKVEEFAAGNPTAIAISTYRYDGLGRRIEKVTPTGTRRYIYDGEDILLEYDGNNVLQARYTHGPGIDEPLSRTVFTPPLAAGQTAVLASTSDGTGGLVVDDRIVVDGQHFAGFVLDASKPLPAAGAPIDSTGSNLPVPPLDVSAFVADGRLTVELLDFGGIRGSRDVYLVVRDSGTNQVVQSQLVLSATPTVYSTQPFGTAIVYGTQTATTQVAGGTLFYHQDGLGTVTDLTDSTGTTAKSYSYDAYGTIVEQTGTVEQPYTYTGREFDSESGLLYYRARYYDPASGRFLQKDPMRFVNGINLYAYTMNNPANFADALGLWRNPSDIYDDAMKRASNSPFPDPHNGLQDAYRHCLASCMLTQENSEFEAQILGWANEKRGDWFHNQEEGEREADERNNACGRGFGGTASSTQDCEQSCGNATRNGTLQTYQQGAMSRYWDRRLPMLP